MPPGAGAVVICPSYTRLRAQLRPGISRASSLNLDSEAFICPQGRLKPHCISGGPLSPREEWAAPHHPQTVVPVPVVPVVPVAGSAPRPRRFIVERAAPQHAGDMSGCPYPVGVQIVYAA